MLFVLRLLRQRRGTSRNRNLRLTLIFLLCTVPLAAQTPDDLLARSAEETDAGEYDAAVRDAVAAAHAYAAGRDLTNESIAWNQAGLARLYAAQYSQARALFEKALAVAASARDFEGVVEEHMNLASTDFFTGRYNDAAIQYDVVSRILDQHPNEKWTSRRRRLLLANRATLDQRLGRYDQALVAYQTALRDTTDVLPEEHAQMLANLGVLYRRMGDPYKALEAYEKAAVLFRRDRHVDGELGVVKNRGIVLALDLHRLDEALAAFVEARTHAAAAGNAREVLQAELYGAETLRRLGRTREAADGFRTAYDESVRHETIEDQWKALYGLARCELEDHTASGDRAAAQHLSKAVDVIEQIRESIRIPSLKSDFFNDKREVFDALIELRLRQGAGAGELFELIERGHSRGWRDHLGLRARVSLTSVQSLLPGNTTLLDYWLSPSGAAVVRVTRRDAQVRAVRVDVPAIRALSTSLAQGDPDWTIHADRLAAQLLPPIEAGSHVIIVGDGAVASVPFDVLDDFVVRHDVTYLPTAALLRSPKTPRRFAPPWTPELRGFADPEFGSAAYEGEVAPLPASAMELRAIASELGGRTSLHTGRDDRKELLFQKQREPLLHIASHAFVDSGAIERSRIMFAAERAKGPATYLFLKEAYELPLENVELVVLSACDTERGRMLPGEGIESFSRAFLAAGAKSTVTALWRVPDRTTADFMRVFYDQLQDGDTRAEALRRTKLRFREKGVHPHFWAGFVLSGEGAIPIPSALRWSTVLIFSSLTLAAAIAVLLARKRSPA
jgi:tetratricopeptide (TPR) repeat protein